jgi:anthranilate synthase component II
MILVIDKYDSFTYNLVQRLGELNSSLKIEVYRNDELTPDEIAAKAPSCLIISRGACMPNEAGISVACVERFAGKLPICPPSVPVPRPPLPRPRLRGDPERPSDVDRG